MAKRTRRSEAGRREVRAFVHFKWRGVNVGTLMKTINLHHLHSKAKRSELQPSGRTAVGAWQALADWRRN